MMNLHVHTHSLTNTSKALDLFFRPLQLIVRWVTDESNSTSYTALQRNIESTGAEIVKMEEQLAESKRQLDQVKKGQINASARIRLQEKRIQLKLAKSLTLRLTTYLSIFLIGLFVFLVILALIFAVSYVLQNYVATLALLPTFKVLKLVKYLQFLFVGLDVGLFGIYTFKMTLMLIINGKVLN